MADLCQKIALAGTAAVAIAATFAIAKPASAQSVAICQSINFRPATCSINTRNGVILEREYSHESCVGNWDVRRGFVTVYNGCRARFQAVSYADDYYPPYYRERPYYQYHPRRPRPRRYRPRRLPCY